MKNNKIIRMFSVLFAVVLCMAAFPLTAFAGGGEGEDAEDTAEQRQDAATINPVALTPEGNLTLVDDIDGEQAEDKQFITVVTKNGNYFYIIIDRAGSSDNVYFLNMVDESDLLAIIEDLDGAATQTVTPTVTEQEQTTDPEPAEDEPEPEAEKSGGMGGLLIFLLLGAAAGGGAFYYFKVLKPQQAVQGGTDLDDLDELDFEGDELMSMDTDEPEQEDEDE